MMIEYVPAQVHPFDVGDTVVISERMYTVEAINLIVVTLRHIDGSRVYQPISLINTVPLCNLTRSGNKKESMTMLLDYSGEAACHGVLTCLRECVGKYVTANSSKLAPQFNISAAPAENPQKIKVIIRYTFNSKGAHQLTDISPSSCPADMPLTDMTLSGCQGYDAFWLSIPPVCRRGPFAPGNDPQ
jgi:hypothetical protein